MVTHEKIYQILKIVDPDFDVSKIDINKNLRDYGFDSMDVFNIILQLQELLHIEIPDADIDKLTTVASIFEYCQARKL